MKSVPRSLRQWFILHFLLDLLFGFPLLFAPEMTLAFFQFSGENFLAARLLGAGLIGIGGVSLLANRAGIETYRVLLKMKILWSGSAIIALLLSFPTAPRNIWLFLILFVMFFAVWTWYDRRL